MNRSKRTLRLALGAALVLAAAAYATVGVHGSGAARSAPRMLLPDLDPVTPQGPVIGSVVVHGKVHWKLGFISATVDDGAGPLIVVGRRSSTSAPMTADQVVEMSDGTTRTFRNVGRLRFVTYPSHRHWHLLGYMVYELRHYGDNKLIRPDEKTGFCLRDDYREVNAPKTAPRKKFYTGECALNEPQTLDVHEGISVGYGDVYTQVREGQDVDLTGVPAGYYYLVHEVNRSHRLHESNYANNASSILIQLVWPRGQKHKPVVDVVAACTDTARCQSGFYYDKIP